MKGVIFHVGMGKTGSTTIQNALASNTAALTEAQLCYLGRWMGMVHPDFDDFSGFQRFLRQSPDGLVQSAHALLSTVHRIHAETGAQTFVLSNEQYLENIPTLADFFRTIAKTVPLKVVIFVRPPATWLPSAYTQWGVAHKTNPGAVQSFGEKARQLMRQYDYIRQWREILGECVTVIPFEETVDTALEFSKFLGVTMKADPVRHQTRPSPAQILLRAACNNVRPGIVLPDVFNAIMQQAPSGTPVGLGAKFAHVFQYDEIPRILAENAETLSYLEREFGMNMRESSPPARPPFDTSELVDKLLGNMLDIVFSQAYQIEKLTQRLDAVERAQASLAQLGKAGH
ncbi:hypothetical protein [Paenirhodobacter hankyongi]|uniref:hypothetical protein n=1 Tax=Paenirhodobacter hankyongi TaxID=2294033 RepID=UPI0011C401E1|nr:hypothetical protein [Sinirhodobacter hankyongi]